MKKLCVLLCVNVLSVVSLPYFGSAQETNPPECCNARRDSAALQAQVTTQTASQISISDNDLQAIGISRSDFVDRLAGSLLLEQVDFIISVSRPVMASVLTLDQRGGRDSYVGAVEGTLLGVRENRVYRIPRARLVASEIEALDHYFITDGRVTVEVTFTTADPAAVRFNPPGAIR